MWSLGTKPLLSHLSPVPSSGNSPQGEAPHHRWHPLPDAVILSYERPLPLGIEYLTVTLGSWVTPHTMEAWVPLMTLWSCGGLVMRVRAVRQGAVSGGYGVRVMSGEQGGWAGTIVGPARGGAHWSCTSGCWERLSDGLVCRQVCVTEKSQMSGKDEASQGPGDSRKPQTRWGLGATEGIETAS